MEITIKTESGIHARPASQIVNTSQKFKSEVIF
ncbi:MAG: HPr family phosphocarrier protein, partial [Bacillota bacterium]